MPIVVLDVSDAEALELAIIENVQRSDLNPLEEASGYQSLANEYNHTQEDIAKIVGKSRSHIANTLRLLNLPEKVKAYINSGKLTAGHARMLDRPGRTPKSSPTRSSTRTSTCARSRRSQRKMNKQQATAARPRAAADQGRRHRGAGTQRLGNALGLKVTITHRASGSGSLQVTYRTLEQLDDVIAASRSRDRSCADVAASLHQDPGGRRDRAPLRSSR